MFHVYKLRADKASFRPKWCVKKLHPNDISGEGASRSHWPRHEEDFMRKVTKGKKSKTCKGIKKEKRRRCHYIVCKSCV
jgi:hypothetical protein